MMLKRTAALLVSITIMCSLTINANAAGEYGFTDITQNEYRDEIEWLRYDGVTNGIGDNKFGPDININQGSFLVMLSRKVCSDTIERIFEADGSYDEKVKGLAKAIWALGYDDYSLTVDKPITIDEAGKMAFRMAGIPVYGETLYSDYDKLSEYPGYDQLIRLGIIDSTLDPNQVVTRDLAAHIVYNILYTDINIKMPEVLTKYNFSIETALIDTNILVSKLNKIPERIKDIITEDGWKVVVGTNYIDQWSAENGIIASGLCIYSEKIIYIADEYSLIHEIGHMLADKLNHPIEIDRLYSIEKENLSKLTGNYCKTNSSEYFAELIEYYINNMNDREAMNRLMSLVPRSYTYIKNLENNNWGI